MCRSQNAGNDSANRKTCPRTRLRVTASDTRLHSPGSFARRFSFKMPYAAFRRRPYPDCHRRGVLPAASWFLNLPPHGARLRAAGQKARTGRRRRRPLHAASAPRHPSLLSHPSALCSRRLQFPAGGGYLSSRPIGQPHASHVDPFRKHPHHHAAHLYVHVLSRAGTAAGGRQTALRKPLVRRSAIQRSDVRRPLLDAAGVAAARLGAAGRNAGGPAPGSFQLLDQHLLRWRLHCRSGRSAACWAPCRG